MDVDKRIKSAADEIRIYRAIALLGAGISLDRGFPLNKHFQLLLWKSLNSDASALKELAEKLGQTLTNAKILIGDDPSKIDLAFNILAHSPDARRTFQYGFKKLNDENVKKPSSSHDIISELLHRRIIKMVISLNWDTLLETAYHRQYGGTLYPDWIKKPHGDAAHPDQNWVLPNERDHLPENIMQEISSRAKDSGVLLIIGYSEKDEEIVSKIIKPLSNQWRVVRIGPHTTGENNIPFSAKEALPKLYECINLNPEVPGCEYINFDNQHDLRSALNGIGLGPADVNVCPRLPEVNIAKQQLETAGSSVIKGNMGSGKSLIAYQTAYDLSKDGWEILRFKKFTEKKEQLMAHLSDLPNKSLLIIDNAQALDKNDISYILENVTDKLNVLIITTDENISRHDKIRVSSENAVYKIAEDFKNRQKELLPIIQKFDNHIGEGYLDIPLESRIDEAAKSSETPWQFNFILTAGWRRAAVEMNSLRENERFDLLLAVISIKQIVSLDIGSSLEWLETASGILGKDKSWIHRALQTLMDRRLIVEGNTIRCPHVRFSEVVIDLVYRNRRDNYHEQLINLFRMALTEEIPSLKGVYWAFDSWISTEDSSYLFKSIINSQTQVTIMTRCWAASSNEDINYASQVLSVLVSRYFDHIDDFILNSKQVAHWIEEADAKSVYGLGNLLNSLGRKDHGLTESIIDQTDPQIIADNLSQISVSDAYVWGYFLGRLVYAASQKWLMKLKDSIDTSALYSLLSDMEVNINDLSSLDELAEGISCLDHSLGIKLVDLASPKIASAINSGIIKFQVIQNMIWFVLGFAPNFLRQDEPSQEQKQIAYKLADAIDAESIAQFISHSKRRDWKKYAELIYFLEEVMPEKAMEIVDLIDFNELDETTKDMWGNPPSELIELVKAFVIQDDCEPARSWINHHSEEFINLNPVLTVIAPESAMDSLNQGYNLDLNLKSLFNWGFAYLTIKRLSNIDKKLASMVLKNNQQGITQGFEFKTSYSYYSGLSEEIQKFIKITNDLTPGILKECLESIDPTIIRVSWVKRLKGGSGGRLILENFINLIIDEDITSLMDIVKELKKIEGTIPNNGDD